MAIIKSFASYQNLSNFGTFVNDQSRTSEYFRITEFKDTLTGGKNGFLIEGSEHLKETTEIKIEILDVTGTPIYYEPGNGIPEYYEGISKIVSVHVYEDTPIGLGKITILGELKTYIDDNGVVRDVPPEWMGVYNVKWERTFNVNKNIANETIVRFYKRPKITIDEVTKPIFNITTPSITQTGLVEGIPQQPVYGSDIRNWTAGTLYKLKITDDSNWTSSVDENVIDIPLLAYSATIKEVLNNKEVLVDIPYTSSYLVSNFPATAYSTTFEYVEGQTIINSALTGSFAKIQLSDLKTFVGDVARVKVYRKSRNEVGDYQFIQDTKLESSEILKDITTTTNTELSYGQFSESNIKNYWVSGSISHPMTINVDKLNASVKVDYSGSNYDNTALLITSQSLSLTEGVEYTLSFKTLLSGSSDSTKTLKAYFSGSNYPKQTIVNVTNSSIYTTKQNVTQNVKATKTGDAKLVFEFAGDDWYLANVSLQNAQETSFSPDEFTLIQDIPRKLAIETYDFKFEFYDINNNYIPVDVKTSKTFTGGNSFTTSTKFLSFQSDRTAFRFSSGSYANPPYQAIHLSTQRNGLTGSVVFGSSSFDMDGIYIEPSNYYASGVLEWGVDWPNKVQYPGGLTNLSDGGGLLHIHDFSGSLDFSGSNYPGIRVGSVVYTASCEGLYEYETIYRFEDGDNAPGLFTTSNANQFIYKATDLTLNPSGQVITLEAKRKNLASTTIGIEVNSGSLKPPLTVGATDVTTGVTLYTLAGSAYPFLSGSTTYSFTGSDQFGNKFSDAVTITPVKILDGLSVSLTNENASLPALSTGFIASGSFVLTSGSVSVKVGNETITHSDGLVISNSFDVVSAIPTGVTTGSLTYSTSDYFITRLDADSGSLELRVRYKDGAGDTTDITKVATYTKNKKAAPVLSFVIGNNNQTATALSTGVQIDAFVTASFAVNEAYNGVTTTKTFTPTLVNASNSYSGWNATATTLSLPNIATGTDSVDIAITGSVVDSENTTRLVYGNISLAKAKKAPPITLALLSSETQTILSSSAGYATPATFTTTVTEGGSSYTYNSGLSSNNTYYISTITGGTNSSGVITPTTPTATTGTTVSLTISYKNSEGSTGTITKTHKVGVSLEGIKGTNGDNGAPGNNGSDGKRTATGLLYYQLSAATAPATPTATSYTFSTNTFTGLTTNWALGAPTFAAGNSNKYWYSTYTAVETTAGGNTAVPTFTTVTQAIGFTGLVTFTSADNISDGTNTSNIVTPGGVTNHIGGANVTTINGGRISTGVITSTGYTLSGADTLASGSYTSAGTILNLDNGSLRSKNFYISSAGSAFFNGSVTATAGAIGGWAIGASSLTGGDATLASSGNLTLGTSNNVIRLSADDATYRIWVGHATAGSAPFRVTKAGGMIASSATITGEINATAGSFTGNITSTAIISGGTITGGTITGGTISGTGLIGATGDFSGTVTANDGTIAGWKVIPGAITDVNNRLKLNSTRPAIEIFDSSGVLRVDISNSSTLSALQAGSVTINNATLNNQINQYESDFTNAQYETQLNANMIPTLLEYNPTACPTVNTGASTSGNYSISANLWGYILNCNTNLEAGPHDYWTSNPYLNYLQNRFILGLSVRAGGTDISHEILDMSKQYDVSEILNSGVTTFSKSTTLAQNDSQGNISGTITLLPNTTYYFVPYIKNGIAVSYRDQGTILGFDVVCDYYTPKIASLSISQEVSKTELVAGGFQVVASTDRYLKVERNASNTNFVAVGGGITATGNVTAFFSSDERLKENIIPIGNALQKIEKLDGVEFDWTDEYIQKESNGKGEDSYFVRKHDVGLIAQQVQKILPEVVAERTDGYLAIKYDRIVPLLVQCIKELSDKVTKLENSK